MPRLFKIFLIIFLIFISESYASKTTKKAEMLFYKRTANIESELELSAKDVKNFDKIAKLMQDGKWRDALTWAGAINNQVLKEAFVDYVLWQQFTLMGINDKDVDFSSLTSFIAENTFLPNIESLKEKAEKIYAEKDIPYSYVKRYFRLFPPKSTDIAFKLLKERKKIIENSLDEKEKKEESESLVVDVKEFWRSRNLTERQEMDFLELFQPLLDEFDFIRRAERLFWDGRYQDGERMYRFIPLNYRMLFAAVAKINQKPKYINNILRTVPREMRDQEILLYSRLKYYHNNKNTNEVVNLLEKPYYASEHQEDWFKYRKLYARELLKLASYKKAYKIISQHGLERGADFADGEWMSGWIALRFLKDERVAYRHFYKLYNNVSYPVTLARGAYWAGRSLEQNKQNKKAIKWYQIAAKYPIYFYGQLAIYAWHNLDQESPDAAIKGLPSEPNTTEAQKDSIFDTKSVKLAFLLARYTSNTDYAIKLFKYSIDQVKTEGEIAGIVRVAKSTQNEAVIVNIAKYASYRGVFFMDDLFPILKIIPKNNPNIHLIHAIIKQESGFHVSAKSGAGAIGFMQLMPATAQEVARSVGLKYNEKRLTTDPNYNITLGSYYLTSMVRRFQGSELLAIASYNAGPNKVREWIKTYGDPRKFTDVKDIVDWIEIVPYAETRNYIQRIIENSIVYEYLFNHQEIEYDNLINRGEGGEE